MRRWQTRAGVIDRDLTADERAAVAMEPRPGRWWQPKGDPSDPWSQRPDGRLFSQSDTDMLIASELRLWTPTTSAQAAAEYQAVIADALSPWRFGGVKIRKTMSVDWARSFEPVIDPMLPNQPTKVVALATLQRGGIHSDPLVRLLAFRVWGERDQIWLRLHDAVHTAAREQGHPLRSVIEGMLEPAASLSTNRRSVTVDVIEEIADLFKRNT
jgi:hypothetical protein